MIQILGTNDFHGRLKNDTPARLRVPRCCRARSSSWRAANPNTVFAAAGDLIGASTFESFIQKDEPTIDALNEAGLESPWWATTSSTRATTTYGAAFGRGATGYLAARTGSRSRPGSEERDASLTARGDLDPGL